MSASYPLVRNLDAFSTRFGVSRRPSRAGSSPISASSFLISSCIVLFYISTSSSLARGAPPPRAHDLTQCSQGPTPARSARAYALERAAGAGLERRRSASGVEQPADALYADRAHLASARRAAQMWAEELARNPKSFDAAWKLARADYWLGGGVPDPGRREIFAGGLGRRPEAGPPPPGPPCGAFVGGGNDG